MLRVLLILAILAVVVVEATNKCPYIREQATRCAMNYLDYDGDGKLSIMEIDLAHAKYLSTIEQWTIASTRDIMHGCDADNDAFISHEDFAATEATCFHTCASLTRFMDHICARAQAEHSPRVKRACAYNRDDVGLQAMRYLDYNHDHMISASELVYSFDNYLNATQRALMPTIAQFYANCDRNGDRLVSWADFQNSTATCLNTCQKLTVFTRWIIVPAQAEYISIHGHARRDVR